MTEPFRSDDLTAVTTPERVGPPDAGRFHLRVADGWTQGRGAFGGLVLGALVRAVEQREPARDRPLRAVSGEIAGPVLVGDAEITVSPLRLGSGMSTWTATLTQAGAALARASVVLGRSRPVEHDWIPAPPVPTPFERIALSPLGPPLAPAFTQYLEFRTDGTLPFSGAAAEPVASTWVRPRRPPTTLGAVEIVALADACWPAALSRESGPRPLGTVAFNLHHLPPRAPLDPGRPLYHRARVVAAREGFLVEFRELWSEAGALLALHQQTIVWIK